MGFACRIVIAERIEDEALPTVLTYGRGDVIRGQEGEWHTGLDPWKLERQGERIYGRGTADNKGQHTINLAALESVLRARGRLGFNVKVLIETGEEVALSGAESPLRGGTRRARRRCAHRLRWPAPQAGAAHAFSARAAR